MCSEADRDYDGPGFERAFFPSFSGTFDGLSCCQGEGVIIADDLGNIISTIATPPTVALLHQKDSITPILTLFSEYVQLQ